MVWQNRLDTRYEVNMAEGQEGGSSISPDTFKTLSRVSIQYVPHCLTSRVAAVGIHEGVGHPLILLKSALLCHAAVYRAQLPTLLLPVGHGCLVYCHFLPTVKIHRKAGRQREREKERGGGQGVIIDRE